MRARLEIKSSDTATLALGDNPAQRIEEMQSEGAALTGKTVGTIAVRKIQARYSLMC